MTTVRLFNPVQAHSEIAKLWPLIKEKLMAGHRMVLTAEDETRSDAQNKLLHAILTEIAKEREWAGKKRDVETWKRLLVAAWCRARGESVELLPALDGFGVDIVFARTSRMSKTQVSELIEFIEAWHATEGPNAK